MAWDEALESAAFPLLRRRLCSRLDGSLVKNSGGRNYDRGSWMLVMSTSPDKWWIWACLANLEDISHVAMGCLPYAQSVGPSPRGFSSEVSPNGRGYAFTIGRPDDPLHLFEDDH